MEARQPQSQSRSAGKFAARPRSGELANKAGEKKTADGSGCEPLVCGNKLCAAKCKRGQEKDWTRKKLDSDTVWLCKLCSRAFSQRQYCEHCKQIYVDTSGTGAVVDGLEWIQCEGCRRWTHVQCEARRGCHDIEALMLDPEFVYRCARCRKLGKAGGRKRVGGSW